MAGNVLHERSGSQAGVVVAPLTFAGWCGIGLRHYKATGALPVVQVQVRKRGVVLCGRVLEAAPARDGQDTDWFKVDCYLGQLWFPHNNVRQCSGLDGRCTCVDADEAAGDPCACAGVPAASAVPPGNTGTTVGGKA